MYLHVIKLFFVSLTNLSYVFYLKSGSLVKVVMSNITTTVALLGL